MTEEDIAWTRERIRDRILAMKLGTAAGMEPWTLEDYRRLEAMWIDGDKMLPEYKRLWIEIEEELRNG